MLRALPTLVLLLSVPIPALSQAFATDRGSILLDGSASYTRRSFEGDGFESRTNRFVVQPSLQYFVVPGLALGLTLDYSVSDNSYSSDVFPSQSSTVRNRGVGPTLSYYYGGADARALPFVSGTYTYLTSPPEADTPEVERAIRATEGSVGVLFLMVDHVGVTAEVFVLDRTFEEPDDTESQETITGFRMGVAAFVF